MKAWNFVTSRHVWMDTALTSEAKCIWSILECCRSTDSGEAYTSVPALMQVAGWGREKVRRAIHELEKAGAMSTRIERQRLNSRMNGSKVRYIVTRQQDWKAAGSRKLPPEWKHDPDRNVPKAPLETTEPSLNQIGGSSFLGGRQ